MTEPLSRDQPSDRDYTRALRAEIRRLEDAYEPAVKVEAAKKAITDRLEKFPDEKEAFATFQVSGEARLRGIRTAEGKISFERVGPAAEAEMPDLAPARFKSSHPAAK
jgi:hypothetical protein